MKTNVDVLISGIGPAALACAWEALQQSKTVLIISNRKNDFLRMQRALLPVKEIKYLYYMIPPSERSSMEKVDLQFFEEFLQHSSIAVKDIERFIMRRLSQYSLIDIGFRFESEISDIDLDNGQALISSQEIVNFTYLIGADGVRHAAATTLNKKEPFIQYNETERLGHRYHLSVHFNLEALD